MTDSARGAHPESGEPRGHGHGHDHSDDHGNGDADLSFDADADAVVYASVPEMDCPSCAGKVGSALDGVAGVTGYDAQPTTGRVAVGYDPEQTSVADVVDAVEAAGYGVTGTDTGGSGPADTASGSVWRSRRALKTWIGGIFLLLGLGTTLLGIDPVLLRAFGRTLSLPDGLFLLAVLAAGQEILRGGYYSALNRTLDIDFLMTAAILGAVGVSLGFGERLYLEAATLAVLFGVAELLEGYAMDRARTSLTELLELAPEEATVRRDGEEVTVPVDEVRVGETAVIRPGEKIPVDGEVLDGESAVDQSPVTGESVPVDKVPGDEVYAGTINEAGYLEVEVTTPPGEDTLSRVIDLVEAAGADRTEREQFVERFAAYYTPAVVGFAVLTAAVPPLLGASWEPWFVRGLTLLVLACPCAFVISTPVSVVSGITSGAKNGVLVKGGSHLEAMGKVENVALDKTGTLTRGELTVTDVVPLGDRTEADVLACARGLEERSEHPVGEAIVAHAEERAVEGPDPSDFEAIAGEGVEADLEGTRHYAGKPALFENLGFDLSHVHAATDGGAVTTRSRELCERNDCLDLLSDLVPDLQAEGKTVILVGREDELEGLVAVADEVRPEAAEAVAGLRERGVERVVMLTGDNERAARAVAAEVGIDPEEVRAELLPEEKVEAVQALDDAGGAAMVGDGVNDAPALAVATVGVAMGAAGTDTALETADVALLADDLSRLPYLRELAAETGAVIRQNVWASLAAKALLALGVPFGLVPIWAAVLVGDAGMTTAVTANAMRLSRVRP